MDLVISQFAAAVLIKRHGSLGNAKRWYGIGFVIATSYSEDLPRKLVRINRMSEH